MSAVGRWVCVAEALADGAGETGVGSVVAAAGTLAVLLAADAAIPVTGVASDVVAAAGAVAREVGIAADPTGAADCEVLDSVGVAAPVGEVTGLVATGLVGVAVTVGDAWSSAGVVDRLGELALAVGVA